MGYSEDDMQRLRLLEMRRDLDEDEEEGEYHIYCVSIGRKPSLVLGRWNSLPVLLRVTCKDF